MSTDIEPRSLQKINSLAVQWCALNGVMPQIPYLQSINPSPGDVETVSLQKINACMKALSKSP